MGDYHKSVMLEECMDGLSIKPSGVYVDVTYGGGGHSMGILQRLGPNGRLIAFDQDSEVPSALVQDSRFTFVHSNFRYIKAQLRWLGVREIDGLLADLGVSSRQLDNPDRGFSHRQDSVLDMRMNQKLAITAADILNSYPEGQLWKLFEQYGEVRNSKTLAREIVGYRRTSKFVHNKQLVGLLERLCIGEKHRYFSQVFQALRIEVNKELESLEEMLNSVVDLLIPGGRLVVLSYHSLEDKMVKNLMRTGNTRGDLIQNEFGIIHRPFKLITKKPLGPRQEELKLNSRSRSAKLRIAEKL